MSDDLVKRLRYLSDYPGTTPRQAADRIEADAKRIAEAVKLLDERDREYNRLTNEMIERHAARIAELEGERDELTGFLKCVASHATMGEMTSIDENLNDICVKITECRNTVFVAGKDAGAKAEKERAQARIAELEAALRAVALSAGCCDACPCHTKATRKARAALEGEKK